jgi:hypothetical protein
VVLTALIIGILFAVSATLERRVFTARIAVGAKVSFGLYFLVVSLCVLPRQIVGFAFDTPALQGKALLYGYAVVVGLLSPFVFRGTWRDLSAGKIAMVFMTSVGLAALTGIG